MAGTHFPSSMSHCGTIIANSIHVVLLWICTKRWHQWRIVWLSSLHCVAPLSLASCSSCPSHLSLFLLSDCKKKTFATLKVHTVDETNLIFQLASLINFVKYEARARIVHLQNKKRSETVCLKFKSLPVALLGFKAQTVLCSFNQCTNQSIKSTRSTGY